MFSYDFVGTLQNNLFKKHLRAVFSDSYLNNGIILHFCYSNEKFSINDILKSTILHWSLVHHLFYIKQKQGICRIIFQKFY